MKSAIRYLAIAAIATLMCLGYALADTTIAPGQRTTTQNAGTITLGGTFQSALPNNPNRTGCLIQNTSAHTMYVYLGPTGSATLLNSFQVGAGLTFSCANQGGATVDTDNVAVTTSITADTFVVSNQQ